MIAHTLKVQGFGEQALRRQQDSGADDQESAE